MQGNDIIKKVKLKFTKDHFLIVVLMGILLMVIVWPTEVKNGNGETKSGQWDSESIILKQQSDMIPDGGTEGDDSFREDAMLSYTAYLESSLESLLGTMEGVGKVRVMVTLEGSGEAIVEKDAKTVRDGTTEVDSAGGSRNTTSISDNQETVYGDYQGSGKIPYIKKMLAPRVEGVVVSAQGGGNIRTAQNITEAIQALFGIEAHKIKVVKMISQ